MSKQLNATHLKSVYQWFAKTSLPRTLAAEKEQKKTEGQSA